MKWSSIKKLSLDLLAIACIGIAVASMSCDKTEKETNGSVQILPRQTVVVDDWGVRLDESYWKGSTLTAKVTITNLGARREFGYTVQLIVIDSTNKPVEPESNPFRSGPYKGKELYPQESSSGNLKFKMSPYSGTTKLYMVWYYDKSRDLRGVSKSFLYDLGSP